MTNGLNVKVFVYYNGGLTTGNIRTPNCFEVQISNGRFMCNVLCTRQTIKRGQNTHRQGDREKIPLLPYNVSKEC